LKHLSAVPIPSQLGYYDPNCF
jgi:hypothetical protein